MSRGHGASRRRNYGRRQSEVRHRHEVDISIDIQGPDGWPRGAAWERAADSDGTSGASRRHSNPAAG